MENIDSGKIKMTDKVTVSENASNMGGSQVYLNVGEVMSVEDLIKSICIASANDSAVALAEYIGGTEEKFVKMMNDKVKILGLSNTNFVNVHGLDDKKHYSCAYDMAIIASELLKHDKILEYSSIYEEYLKKNDGSSVWMVNTNKLIKYYNGLDGLKTGYTKQAGYNLTATAKRNNMRLISVVMGRDTSEVRSKDTIDLLDYGFNNYKIQILKNKTDVVDEIKINKANQDKVSIIPKNDLSILLMKNENPGEYSYETKINELKLPIKSGDTVGNLLVKDNSGKIVKEVELTVEKDISKISFIRLWGNFIKGVITGD